MVSTQENEESICQQSSQTLNSSFVNAPEKTDGTQNQIMCGTGPSEQTSTLSRTRTKKSKQQWTIEQYKELCGATCKRHIQCVDATMREEREIQIYSPTKIQIPYLHNGDS